MLQRHPTTALCAPLLLAAGLLAQPGPAGVTEITFANTTGRDSPTIPTTVHYPATRPGRDVPIRARAGGHPVIVFLHGFGSLGNEYPTLGAHFAAHGYVVAAHNTARTNRDLQVLDGIAMFTGLAAANRQAGHFLRGALAMDRVGIAGHSRGGGNTGKVLASNPGYRAGLALAPVDPGADAARVRVPLAIVHGRGDFIVDWQTGHAFWSKATGTTELRVFYLMNDDCDHLNLAGLFLTNAASRAVWQRTAGLGVGWFGRYLERQPAGLEDVVGPSARSEPRLSNLEVVVDAPDLWQHGPRSIGSVTGLRVTGEPGPAAVFTAAATGSVATPFGTLRLDPATLVTLVAGRIGTSRLLAWSLPIPNLASLVGAKLPLQAGAIDRRRAARLSDLRTITLTR